MKQIYKATIKQNGKNRDIYFENKEIANQIINHLLKCKTCEKTNCPFYKSEFIESGTIRLFDSLPDLGKMPKDILSNLDNILDEMIDKIGKDLFKEDDKQPSAKDIFNKHYFGKKFEA